MSTATIPITDREAAGRSYTKRVQHAAQLQVITLLAAVYGYGYFGWQGQVASAVGRVTSWFGLQVALSLVPLYLLWTLLSVPFWYYSLTLHRRFDLEGSTAGAWFWVALKATLLKLLYLGVVVEIAFIAHAISPTYGWAWSGLLNSLVVVVVANSVVWFLSWFFPVKALADQEIAGRIDRLARRAGVQLSTIREAQVSGSTRQANAWITGLGRFRSLVISDTLLKELSAEELDAITAHELGHCVHHDMPKRVLLQSALFLATYWLIDLVVQSDIGVFYDLSKGWHDLGFVPGFVLLWYFGNTYGNIILAAVSRRQERAADRYAWELTGRAGPFITAIRKLTDLNLVVWDKSTQWKYGHPVTADRLKAAAEYAQQHGESLTCADALPAAAVVVEKKTVKSSVASLFSCVLVAIGGIVSILGIFVWYMSPEDWQAALCIILFGAIVFLPIAVQALVTRRKKMQLLRKAAVMN